MEPKNISKAPAGKFKPLRTSKARNLLLSIGIDDYAHHPKLNNAVRDADAAEKILTEKYGFELLKSFRDEGATRVNIIDFFNQLIDNEKIKEGDRLLIWYSGHGAMIRKSRGAWITNQAKSPAQGVSNSDLRDILSDLPAKHILLISDSCFSGSLIAEDSRSLAAREADKSRRVLTSGRKEFVADGRPGEHSPFATQVFAFLNSQTGRFLLF